MWYVVWYGAGGGCSVLPIELKMCNHVVNTVAEKNPKKMLQCVIIVQLIEQYAHFDQFARKKKIANIFFL